MNRTATHDEPGRLTGRAWRLDPEQTTAEFRVGTLWGLVTVRGRLTALDGSLSADGQIRITLDAASVRTRNPLRDLHLRSSDFFDARKHPHVHFHSTSVQPRADGRWQIIGELQTAGQRLEIELTPIVRFADDRLTVQAETTIDQRQLGMTYTRFGIRTHAAININAHLVPPAIADPTD
jgi:polyisoprenoid-binding protein YceI